jgi:hypothetical protein
MIETYGFFWDYENVPFRKDNKIALGTALKNFLSHVKVGFAKVYSHKVYPEDIFDYLRKIPNLQIKSVNISGPNAADQSLIRSCQSVMKDKPEITHVFLITGDDDFHSLIDDLKNEGKKVGIISYSNCSKRLQKKVHFRLEIEKIVMNPKNWWKDIETSKSLISSATKSIPRKKQTKTTGKKKFQKPKLPNKTVSLFHSMSKPGLVSLPPPRKKIEITFSREQWNGIFQAVNKIYQNELLKTGNFHFNPVELTYEMHQLMKTGEMMTLTNSQILLLLKKLGNIGFLIEHVTDSWMLAENPEQNQNQYLEKILVASSEIQ